VLLNRLGLWWESREAWRWRWDVDDARLRVFLRLVGLVSMCVVAGVSIGHVALYIHLDHRRGRRG
jgi:hypothetical protein